MRKSLVRIIRVLLIPSLIIHPMVIQAAHAPNVLQRFVSSSATFNDQAFASRGVFESLRSFCKSLSAATMRLAGAQWELLPERGEGRHGKSGAEFVDNHVLSEALHHQSGSSGI